MSAGLSCRTVAACERGQQLSVGGQGSLPLGAVGSGPGADALLDRVVPHAGEH